MELIAKTLTDCQVDGSGSAFRLSFDCVDGASGSVILPVDSLRALLMTLPDAIERALKARYRDDTLKVVFPMGGWTLQGAAGSDSIILTMTTPDGFKVSFSLTQTDASGLASSLNGTEVAVKPATTFN